MQALAAPAVLRWTCGPASLPLLQWPLWGFVKGFYEYISVKTDACRDPGPAERAIRYTSEAIQGKRAALERERP